MREKLINLIKQSAELAVPIDAGAKARVKGLVLEQISGLEGDLAAPTVAAWRQKLFTPVFRYAAVLAGVLVFASAGAAYASQQALPGDLLYPIKLDVEQAQLDLAFSQQAKIQLATKFTGKRIAELQTLTAQEQNLPEVSVQPGTSTPVSKPQKDNSSRVSRAQAQVDKAIGNLQQKQQQLQEQGQNVQASNLNQTITRFKNQIKQIHPAKKDNPKKSDKNGTPDSPARQNGSDVSSSTSPSVKFNNKGNSPQTDKSQSPPDSGSTSPIPDSSRMQNR